MRVGVKVRVFNYVMRKGRKKMGYSQKILAELTGTNIDNIGKIERLEKPRMDVVNVPITLTRIAKELEVDFDEIFPESYLDLLREDRLLRRSWIEWEAEIPLSRLPPSIKALQLPSPDEIYEKMELKDSLIKALEVLTPRERDIIERLYGLKTGGRTMSLEEVATIYSVSRERIRQIQQRAIRRLGHPARTEFLKPFLYA